MVDTLSIAAYLENRVSRFKCSECGLESLFVYREFVVDDGAGKVFLSCVCGHTGEVKFSDVQTNMANDGYHVQTLQEFKEGLSEANRIADEERVRIHSRNKELAKHIYV